ncbi:hypothetical protein BGX29_009842 [Mortierella sp. GBA35]|nr:hypothetical protein BGX29_009842 [Mortierella sp. GBA35]
MAAIAWPCSRRLWSTLVVLGLVNALLVISITNNPLVHAHPHVDSLLFRSNNNNHNNNNNDYVVPTAATAASLHHPFRMTYPACICLDQRHEEQTCPSQPQCQQGLQLDSDSVVDDTIQEIQAPADTRSTDATTTDGNHEQPTSIENKPASSPTIPGSTVVVYPQEEATPTQASSAEYTVTSGDTIAHDDPLTTGNTHPEEALVHSTPIVSPSASGAHSVESIKPSPVSTAAASTGSPTAKRPLVTTAPPQPERHIPSYEQWRKQVLEKKNKPAEVTERKQRKRKPYQENAVDVAIGGEDEIGFVFPNLDSGNNKGADERAQLVGDQLGNGPDLKLAAGRDKEWIKSEYAKDPKDRFNHASATCAASVVKASKDATSITAILNEGKDNYMLNKCSTKEKFFVVELCEEILVDTFILGNYEFFSSTFKDFVVSVNRYPPRDDGWSILGQFQARNTRDAQVFKPATPQLATYIRFDFVNHYGNEYYCPVTLLRVYGATALEQLKQEEEEEKRLAEEEKRRAEMEKAKQAVLETEDDDDGDDNDEPEIVVDDSGASAGSTKDHPAAPMETGESFSSDTPSSEMQAETQQGSSTGPVVPSGSAEIKSPQVVFDGEPYVPQQNKEEAHHKDTAELHLDPHTSAEHSTTGQPTFVLPEWPTEESGYDLFKDDPSAHHSSGSPDTTLNSFGETMTATADQPPTDILQPFPSTTPASMQDDEDWRNGDLGMITLSPKNKPTHAPKPQSASKSTSAGLGTPGGSSSATDSSAHPHPTVHSSQDSVYKNIVNRLKALELNSSLSYQYLEEQSNVFNEVLESSEQKINQLVTHLNEAHRRLETLGRKYDQLAYSYRSHVEVDGEKRRQEFINLSSQVHLLGTQLVFQRQLFVVGAITLFSIVAFIAITRSSSMQYAIHQSPLGVKLRAMSRHKGSFRSNDIPSSVRIGSVEALSQFDQSTFRVPHIDGNRNRSADEDCNMTPPISPMSPLTPDPGHTQSGRMSDLHQRPGTESHHTDDNSSHPNGEVSRSMFAGDTHLPLPHPHSQPDTSGLQVDSPDLRPSNLNTERFLVSRTPYPTPKSSNGSGQLFLHPNQSHSATNTTPFPIDYRPDSPVFQGPSSGQDDGQLSDADVAYMSRDMNVGRMNSSSSGPLPATPVTKRLSISYYNQFHHSANRPSSSLRMDTTASLTSSERTHLSPGHEIQRDGNANSSQFDRAFQESTQLNGAQGDDETAISPKPVVRTPEVRKELDEDVGFVSDSVLDSASERLGRRVQPQNTAVLGDWDRHHGAGVILPEEKSEDDDDDREEGEVVPETFGDRRPSVSIVSDATATAGHADPTKERPRLARESSLKSRRRSSHSIHRTQEPSAAARGKNYSASAAVGLGVGLGLEMASSSEVSVPAKEVSTRPEPYPVQQQQQQQQRRQSSNELEKDEKHDDGTPADDDVAMVPGQSIGRGERRRRAKGPMSPTEDQTVPRRRMSYGRQESVEKDDMEEQAQEGDDERSPQVSRKS